ncbi:MAG: hypothetical protein K2Y27_32675 [Xanthobacteraceae bacterium]|nr:hypothetical protein [Xanthobacteraceae bacterium]
MRNTNVAPDIAKETYDYYIGELKPFSRKLAIPGAIVPTTARTLVELGDIKAETTSMKFTDLSYLPR